MLVLLIERIYRVVEMASCSMIIVPSFMKVYADVEAILRFGLRNLTDCNIGIIDGRDL
jgi:hypothetical protein